MAELLGMTWNHSRGYDPMVATSAEFSQKNPDVKIDWEKRSLQAFADLPIEEMSGKYDLIVIDHPHVGEVARTGLLMPLDGTGHDEEIAVLAKQTVGASHRSYEYDGRQWALAIDAATPVAAHRPDLVEKPPSRWDEVLALAEEEKVAFALVPINALMTYFGLLRNMGHAIAQDGELAKKEASIEVLGMMREIVSHINPCCLEMDPIAIYDWMGSSEDAPGYSPFGYGYTNYSRDGYCKFPLCFADSPGVGDNGPGGTVLGGTGISISASCKHTEIALDYAFWIAGADCQKSTFFASGGQPGNMAAWDDDDCNASCRNFFRNTKKTLEAAWLRPRYDGYMVLQDEAGDLVHACLKGEADESQTTEKLQQAYERSIAK